MNTIEGVLIVYGKRTVDCIIIEKQAAINAAQKAKEQGKILDYRVEEETETTGKIIATMVISFGQKDTDRRMEVEEDQGEWVKPFNWKA